MSRQSPVRIPNKRRVQMFCQSGLPLLVFVGCATMVVWLWNSDMAGNGTLGEFFSRKADITPPVAGEVVVTSDTPPLQEFQEVRKGQVIIELDKKPLDAHKRVFEAEADALKAKLDEIVATAKFDDQRAIADHWANVIRIEAERAGLTVRYLEAWQEYSVAQVQYQRNKDYYDLLRKFANVYLDPADNKIKPQDPDDHDKSQRVVSDPEMYLAIRDMQVAEKTFRLAKSRFDEIKKAGGSLGEIIKKLPPPPSTDIQALLAPVEKELLAKQAEIQEVEAQKELLKIRAPFDGVVTAVYAQPNQAVQPGTPICTIASTKVEYVLAYVRQNSPLRPSIGMKADIRFRGSKEVVSGSIVKIGAQVEAVSPKQLVDPNTQEWGLPIAIEVNWASEEQLAALQPRPGEIVSVHVDPTKDRTSPTVTHADGIRLGRGEIVFAGN